MLVLFSAHLWNYLLSVLMYFNAGKMVAFSENYTFGLYVNLILYLWTTYFSKYHRNRSKMNIILCYYLCKPITLTLSNKSKTGFHDGVLRIFTLQMREQIGRRGGGSCRENSSDGYTDLYIDCLANQNAGKFIRSVTKISVFLCRV